MSGARSNGKLVDPAVIAAIPIGRENALGALDIWKRMGCWSPVTARQRLLDLAKEGVLHHANEPKRPNTLRYVYWKDGVVA